MPDEMEQQQAAPDETEQLYNSIKNESHEIPMNAPESAAQAEPAKPAVEEFELDWNGQKIKADRDKFTKWAQMGYDYNQKIGSVSQREKQLQDDYNRRVQESEQKYSPYRDIDEYSQKNPQWWNHVQQAFQQQQQNPLGTQLSPELKSYLEPIVNDYSQVKNFIQEYQKGITEKQVKEQDSQLETQIKSIGEKYNLDLSAKDANGQSLEQRVIDHAIQNKIPTFKAAFLDYYHEDLQKQAEARGREAVQKEMDKRKKAGLLGESSTPSSGKLPNLNVKGSKGYLSADQILKRMGG